MKNKLRTPVRPVTSAPEPSEDAPGNRRRGILIAAGVVLLAAAATLAFSPTNPFAGQPSPQQVAEQYLSAQDGYDAAAARALLAADVTLNDLSFRQVDEIEAGFEVLSIYGFSFDPFDCAPAESSEPGRVSCSYQMYTALNDPVGHPPVAGTMHFEIVDGKITSIDNRFPYLEFAPNVFRPFTTWLALEHGADGFSKIFEIQPSGIATSRMEPEALDLARSLVAEYRESSDG